MSLMNMFLDDELTVKLDALHNDLRNASKTPNGTEKLAYLVWPSGEPFFPFEEQPKFTSFGTYIEYHGSRSKLYPNEAQALYRKLKEAHSILRTQKANAVSKRNLVNVLLALALEHAETLGHAELLARIRARPGGRLGRPALIAPEVKEILEKLKDPNT